MKKCTLDATDENILQSIKDDTYGRSDYIKDFIEALDLIEDNEFISLDAKWGEGKTFYVKQIEMTLRYLNGKTWGYPVDELKSYFENNQTLDSISLNHSYLPIYYDAWLYDNHDDPLMSLILIMAKQCKKYLNTRINSGKVSDKIISLLDSLKISIGNISVTGNIKKIKDEFSGNDILASVKTAEEIKECVKGIFNDVIVETAQKLVIFIDELDRCRPSFAIEMLERIKHYFDDDRIIIIASVNKEQLVHTISKYYGTSFDATGYLNKFFDMNIHLPKIKMSNDFSYKQGQYWVNHIVVDLVDYYKLSLRNGLILRQYIELLSIKYVNDNTFEGCVLSVFVPIVLVLDIVDQGEKAKFVNGESDLLDILFKMNDTLFKLACRMGYSSDEQKEEKYRNGFAKIKEAYEYGFDNKKEMIYIGDIELSNNIKELCINLCNGFKREA